MQRLYVLRFDGTLFFEYHSLKVSLSFDLVQSFFTSNFSFLLTFSIILRSGLWVGHSKVEILFSVF